LRPAVEHWGARTRYSPEQQSDRQDGNDHQLDGAQLAQRQRAPAPNHAREQRQNGKRTNDVPREVLLPEFPFSDLGEEPCPIQCREQQAQEAQPPVQQNAQIFVGGQARVGRHSGRQAGERCVARLVFDGQVFGCIGLGVIHQASVGNERNAA
jgi:hypothetical protein